NWIRGAEFADSVGVDMLTTSLGYTEFDIPSQNHNYGMLNGRTAPMSIAATMAARKGIFVLNAAGNDGDKPWHYVGVPADADSICTVGAVDTVGRYAPFSSVGPTADGRIKPDLVATGWGAWICDQSTICYPGNGTSFATPILAGAVACFWQFKRELNNIQLLNEIKSRSSNAAAPNNKIGWGIPKLCRRNDDLDFKVAYNPNTSILSIALSESLFGFVKLKVYDMQGKLLISKDIDVNATKILLNTTIAAEGLYLVTLETSKGKLSKKFFR
ncbi:MAG: S8 family peptidase, partial [Bacteroidia bacterium]|nr:S8 family peptidase [Bacteroidia bacterium]